MKVSVRREVGDDDVRWSVVVERVWWHCKFEVPLAHCESGDG